MSGSQTAEAALLAWYEAMGVDEVIGEVPVDYFAVRAPELPQARPVTPARRRKRVPPLPGRARPRPLPSLRRSLPRSRAAP